MTNHPNRSKHPGRGPISVYLTEDERDVMGQWFEMAAGNNRDADSDLFYGMNKADTKTADTALVKIRAALA